MATVFPVSKSLLVTALVLFPCLSFAQVQQESYATVTVTGYGFFGNRELRKTILFVQPTEQPQTIYNANFIEDTALVLLAKLNEDGFLKPRIESRLTLANGSVLTHFWDKKFDTFLPRPLEVKRAAFIVHPGIRYYYRQLEFTGLRLLNAEKARAYFIGSDFLIPLKRTRVFTPDQLNQSVANLNDVLIRKGYSQAKVSITELQVNDKTGAVSVRVLVEEGLMTVARSVQVQVFAAEEGTPQTTTMVHPNEPYSQHWRQDLIQELLRAQYQKGFPDATADITVIQSETKTPTVYLDLLARVTTGPQIQLNHVKFNGLHKTKLSLLEKRVKLKESTPLDRIAVNQGRQNLTRLGIFDSLDVLYEDVNEEKRDVIYVVKEGDTIDFSLLVGYGSYELGRVGFELEQHNVFGRAHSSQLLAVQSFKSSSADYQYTMPELLGNDINLSLKASGLRREELSFRREEIRGSIGIARYFQKIKSDVDLRYSYQLLNANDSDVPLTGDVQRAQVATLNLDIQHDRRDNPLLPRQGYKIFANFELAATRFGGEVNYQRVGLGASVHQKVGFGRFIHLGLSQGVIMTVGGAQSEVPFNKRFFLGGDTSVRGYQQGEAAPRNDQEQIVGAETYSLGNIELEQQLTPFWSVVAFVDTIGFASDVGKYPFDEILYSVGGGIRWKTIIGPVRLEYGYNPNPRAGDPSGTLHFSIGFPF